MANSESDNPQKKKRENVALFISILALVVSGISLWDSHRVSGLQIAQAGPDLNVKHSHLRRYDPAKPHDFTLWMDVKNEGHLYVKVKEITVVPVISLLPGDESRKACIDDVNKKTFKGDASETIKPRKFGLIGVNITLPDSCTDTGWRLFADVTFKGIDQVKDSYESLPEGIMAVVPDH